MSYWVKRFLNILSLGKKFKPWSLCYCIPCRKWCSKNHTHRRSRVTHTVIRFMPWPPKRRMAATHRLTAPRKLPDSVDLRPIWASVKYPQPNQGEIGNCTAETAAYDLALMKIKQDLYKAPFSVAFIYAMERMDIGTFPDDSGANMIDEGNALANHGCCFESTMPTSLVTCNKKPSSVAIAEALNYKCDPNQHPVDVNDFQTAIYNCQQNPILGSVRMGWPVPQSAMDAIDNGGFVPMPADNEQILGGHSQEGAVYKMLKGPKDKAPRLYVGFLQSWGEVGDMSGWMSTFWFPYPEFFQSQWGQNNYGVDAYQQPDLPSTNPNPPQPQPQPSPKPTICDIISILESGLPIIKKALGCK